MGLFDRFFKKNTPEKQFTSATQPLPFHSSVAKSAELFDELDRSEYFTYTDSAHLPQLKAELRKGLIEEHYFPFIESGSPKYEKTRSATIYP
jgi:hypothetical protein